MQQAYSGSQELVHIVVPADDAGHMWGARRVGALARMANPYLSVAAI
jgi:hypothetical protein